MEKSGGWTQCVYHCTHDFLVVLISMRSLAAIFSEVRDNLRFSVSWLLGVDDGAFEFIKCTAKDWSKNISDGS